MGREMNPRLNTPSIDIKTFMELRPGMMGWVILNLAFVAKQYRTYGFVTDSIILITLFQSIYVLDALWMEPAMLTTIDITSDGFGFMLAFGDLVWVPFIYSLQTKYLSAYPLKLGLSGIAGVVAVQAFGYWIFRSANNQKNRFRTDPNDPRVHHLKYLKTKRGTKLLISGWWGFARHPNYLGDIIMSWAWCLPTGIAGYAVTHSSPKPSLYGQSPVGGPSFGTDDLRQVVPGEARGWGMAVTYFYVIYFVILLIHRELRDEEDCKRKYGADWEEYRRIVKWRILPGVY